MAFDNRDGIGTVGNNNVERTPMAVSRSAPTNPCKLFSELATSDGGIVFDGLKQGRVSAADVNGLKSLDGNPLAFLLRLHVTSYPDLPAQIMDKLDLTAVDKQGNNFLHELSTNSSPEALSMIQYIPAETKQQLFTQPNNAGLTPQIFAERLNNTAFLRAVNPPS